MTITLKNMSMVWTADTTIKMLLCVNEVCVEDVSNKVHTEVINDEVGCWGRGGGRNSDEGMYVS